MSTGIVLVTGASGFVGANVLQAVLEAGYPARALVRPTRTATLKTAYGHYGDKFEVAEIDDLATSDLSAAFKGVWAVLHVGSPLPDAVTAEVSVTSAIDGTKRVIDAAHAAGVKKIVFTSTFATLFDPALTWKEATYTEKGKSVRRSALSYTPKAHLDWFNPSREDALKEGLDPWTVYVIGKTLAEKSVWKFADEHKDYDVTTINAGFVLGGYAKGQTIGSLASGSNRMVYGLIAGGPLFDHGPFLPIFVNTRDLSALHVRALQVGDVGQPKRILAQGGPFIIREAAEYLHKAHPEIEPRIAPLDDSNTGKVGAYAKLVGTNAKELLGFDKFIGVEQTIDETVAALLEKEQAASK
ncbi:NAD(P)-binding protein [Auriscalpium vulgare]|uniref:NAD(P)-binding protein n=1 Tax=Auriscalpium vulgare TaxID=40419 RepID=A0ACB8S1P2_9AGAM|nr:NAD(P)-binding protein [Auriscalpium vulgare]